MVAVAADSPAPLLWPLPIREGCTSSFGEFRRSHFHGGVDLRTHQEVGFPVYAVADGRVVRFRREPYGYGRVIYLELKDGRTAVYGHVLRFENAKLHLEDKLRQTCERADKSFPGDVVLEPPLPVKAGDLIAYSGDLGVGSPHLHFEIRRGDDMCDPFAEGLPLPDGLEPPRLLGIAFVPRDASGRVEGDFFPVFVPAVRTKEGSRLSRTVALSGAVDAEALVADHLGIKENTTGAAILKASLDGKSFFDMDLRCISLAFYKQSPALFDPDQDREGAAAYRLRRLPGLGVAGFSGDGLPAGAAPGALELVVTATNRGGLSTTVAGEVTVVASSDLPCSVLPGSGYHIRSAEILPGGLVLECARATAKGETPLRAGSKLLGGYFVQVGDSGKVQVLLPREILPKEGATLSAGDSAAPWLTAAGPGNITSGGVRLNLPDDTIGTLQPASHPGALPGSAVSVKVGPSAYAYRATLEFPGFKPAGGVGLFAGGAGFVDAWAGKAVSCKDEGVYFLQEDRTPPTWGQPRLVTIERIGAVEVRLTLHDEGSGPSAGTIRLTLDGAPAFVDWDPDNQEVRLDVTSVKPGKHTLKGSLSDFLGNGAALPPRTFTTR